MDHKAKNMIQSICLNDVFGAAADHCAYFRFGMTAPQSGSTMIGYYDQSGMMAGSREKFGTPDHDVLSSSILDC